MDGTRKTLTVPDAGKTYFGLGRGASYEAARRGDLPLIRIGRTMRVPVVALEKMLADAAPARPGDALADVVASVHGSGT